MACSFFVVLDARDELRFQNTHPLVEEYIRKNFEKIKGYKKNPKYQIYKNRKASNIINQPH